MTSPRTARIECPTCREHLTAVLAGQGHVSLGQWSAFLEHRASGRCQSGKQIHRRAPRRLPRQAVHS